MCHNFVGTMDVSYFVGVCLCIFYLLSKCSLESFPVVCVAMSMLNQSEVGFGIMGYEDRFMIWSDCQWSSMRSVWL